MDWFYLFPGSISALVVFVLAGILTGFLFLIRKKSWVTWLMTATSMAFTLYTFFSFLEYAGHLNPYFYLFAPLYNLSILYTTTLLIALSYVFLEACFLREAKVVLWMLGTTVGAISIYVFYQLIAFGPRNTLPLYLLDFVIALTVIWAIAVFLRKALRFSTYHGRYTGRLTYPESLWAGLWRRFVVGWMKLFAMKERKAAAHRSFALAFLFPILMAIMPALRDNDILSPTLAGTIFSASSLLFVAVLGLVIVNHAPEPSTFQIKLVGLSLFTMLAVLGQISLVLFSEAEVIENHRVRPPQNQALRFAPDGTQRYRVDSLALDFDEVLGERLDGVDAGGRSLVLGFAFPFYEKQWSEVTVSRDGLIGFGGRIAPKSDIYFYDEQPKIAPFRIPLIPQGKGGVFVKQTPDRTTITWYQMAHFGASEHNSFQLVLHANGVIDIVYGEMATQHPLWIRGLYPGGPQPKGDRAAFFEALPTLAYGSVLVEDMNARVRTTIHGEMVGMFYGVLGATLFILIVFPLFFHTSLVKPLNALLVGVRRVNAGERDVAVPLYVKDEIGYLTRNFNQMTTSLREAEAELKAYVEGLEAKVAERTAELQQSLDNLRTTQAQLIQAEKMSSLGQMTAGVAHEIKNPLNFINNLAEVNVELTDELNEALTQQPDRSVGEVLPEITTLLTYLKTNAAKIHEQGQRADEIIRSMMQHAATGTGIREQTDLNTLVEEYANLAYHGMRAQNLSFNVMLERDYDEAVGQVSLVPQEIGRVLLNLLNNAFHAVAERAAGESSAYQPTVQIKTRREEDTVIIQVKDNGRGIAPTVREKVFEPFFTTKPPGQGTGLGLSLSYDIITQGHGGALTVASDEGDGATFTVMLPTG